MSDEVWTVKRLLEWTTGFFAKHNIESARLEAEVLLAAAMGVARIDLYVGFETEPSAAARATLRDWVKRRVGGEPVAYLVGYKEFFSLKFAVDSTTLIPRCETELLVSEAIDHLRADATLQRVCDVGTGSGCVAIAIAAHIKNISITATDISSGALAIAQKNAHTHRVANRIQIIQADLLSSADRACGVCDMIVSNLPYVSEAEYAKLPATIKDYEPRTALVAEDDGTALIARLVHQAAERLRHGGWLLVEHSPMNANRVAALFTDAIWENINTMSDDAQLPRITQAQRRTATG